MVYSRRDKYVGKINEIIRTAKEKIYYCWMTIFNVNDDDCPFQQIKKSEL